MLRRAEEVSGNVAATCRYYGISRQVFYKWRRRFEEGGEEGLRPNGPAQPGHRLPEAFPECSACRATCLNRSSPNGRADDESCVPTADNGSVPYVTTEFAAEGAEVFVSGRSAANVKDVADRINAAGGTAHVDVVDACDAAAVDDYVSEVASRAGSIDVACDPIGPRIAEYRNRTPILELPVDLFMVPQQTVLRSRFVTARACAWRMVEQGSGVLVFVTGGPARPHGPGAAAVGAAFAATENLSGLSQSSSVLWALRSVGLRIAANPDTRTIQDATLVIAEQMGVSHEAALARLEASTMLQTSPRAADTARAAAFLASDRSRMMTGNGDELIRRRSVGLRPGRRGVVCCFASGVVP